MQSLVYSSPQNMNCRESSVRVNLTRRQPLQNALSGPQPQESPSSLTASPVPECLSSTSTNITETWLI